MGETIFGSLGFEDAPGDPRALTASLAPLVGRPVRFTLRRNEYAIFVDFTACLTGAVIREDVVETGHLTVHEHSCQLINDAGVRLFIPLGDLRGVEATAPGSLRFLLPGYTLHLNEIR